MSNRAWKMRRSASRTQRRLLAIGSSPAIAQRGEEMVREHKRAPRQPKPAPSTLVRICTCRGHLHDGDQQSHGTCYRCSCEGEYR